jgi:tripartite-type tricarboxylate transporter receptor subunit TctC
MSRNTGGIRFLLALSAWWLLPLSGVQAAEANYPTRPIRMVVPFVAGGGTDLLARLISPRMSDLLGQQIVVDNRGGAGSVLGTQIVAKSLPDGYTLGMMDTAFAINPGFADKLPYDADRDFTFVAIIATSPTVMVTHPGLKVRTIQELIAAARANPGKIKGASAGIGSSSHLTIAMFNAAAKINLLHIPYKGAGAAILDILGGHSDLTFAVPGSVLPQIQAGQMIPLVLTGKKPFAQLPNVPTFAAIGLPEVDPESFRFIVAPADIPPAVNKRLTDVLTKVMGTPEFRTRLVDNGFDPEFQKGNDARAFVSREITKWRKAVKDSGAKAN